MNNIGLQPPDVRLTRIMQRLEAWLALEISQGDPSPNTMRSYLCSARLHLAWCESSAINPLSASDQDLKKYRAKLVQHNYQPATIRTYLAGVRRLYEAIQSWGWRADNPARGLKARKDLTSRSERIISKFIPDRTAFLNLYLIPNHSACKGMRDQAILRILCYTGIRVGELCALDLEDLSMGLLPTLTVRAGKGRKRRHIPLGDEDTKVLRTWLDERKGITRADPQALFISLDHRFMGTRLSTRGARGIVDHYLQIAGLKKPGRSCHALRHSTATWLLEAGVPMRAIADLLGHSSVDTTAIYARIVDHRKYTPGEMLSRDIRERFRMYNFAC